jgi:hypothetical protein
MKLTDDQQIFMDIFCKKFYPKRKINVVNGEKISYGL